MLIAMTRWVDLVVPVVADAISTAIAAVAVVQIAVTVVESSIPITTPVW